MAYEKQEWKCGDTVTADKLNHMEDGIESANSGGGSTPLIVTFTQEEEPCPGGTSARTKKTYSHSWKEIHDSLENGIPAYIKMTSQQGDGIMTIFDPIAAAVTNNDDMYILITVATMVEHSFPNPTDKEWYDGACK